LQKLEAGLALLVQHDDLAVEDGLMIKLPQPLDDCLIALCKGE
jgi:hypothetical protein